MPESSVAQTVEASEVRFDELLGRLTQVVEKSAELLPAQGPITAFVFLNTLQALEHVTFDEGVKRGAQLFGCQPYLSEDRYREKMTRGRIHRNDLSAVLEEDLGGRSQEPVGPLGTRFALQLAMLQYPLRSGPTEELQWFVAETDALRRFRHEVAPALREKFIEETRHWIMRDFRGGKLEDHDPSARPEQQGLRRTIGELVRHYGEATIERWSEQTWESMTLQLLWRICRQGVAGIESSPPVEPGPIRHRDLLLAATGEDTDADIHEVLIRFCAAYCDQGFASWQLPHRDHGFFRSFCAVYRQPLGPPDERLAGLNAELMRIEEAGLSPAESLFESLELLGVGPDEWETFIPATMLALRGWSGMIWQMETRGDRVALGAPRGTLIELLAVRLILERLALAHVAQTKLGYHGPLAELRSEARRRIAPRSSNSENLAFQVFQIAQVIGWFPKALDRLSRSEWKLLLNEVEAFSSWERRRVLQLAFERRFREQALDTIAIHARKPVHRVESPRFQAVFCIDTREESFRRHLEEVSPDVETFAAPGFFCVPIYYRGASDAHFSTLCPIVVRPKHWVVEEVVLPLEEEHRRRAATRRALGTASHQLHMGSRSFAGGALLTAGLGVLASIPLVARVLFPRVTARIRRTASQLLAAPLVTRLTLERTSPTPGPNEDQLGFSVPEMADFGERVLRDIGLTSNFARIVMFLGHGSICLNNPHKSCYDCGACSGSAGSPNARVLAAMLNDSRVREILAGRGLNIPDETIFLGGLHNTCDDTIRFFDLDQVTKSHFRDFEAARETLDEACERNAHERCRRFDSAPLHISFADAHRHVEGRSEDLAQTRPEFGNASNAMCFVGRRGRTRGLYLDRRSFMHSYDFAQDDAEFTILARILGPVVVVCSGINLQYYFSYVDSPGWGCGTKLPHNVTSLLGVMDGHMSDLRCGLPWQGVEIHEPLRLLLIVEATPEAMEKIMDRNKSVGNILRNGWMQLAVLDPNSDRIQLYQRGVWVPYEPQSSDLPQARRSVDWYRGWRDHLGFAEITG